MYWTKLPSATIPAWHLWRYATIHGAVTTLIFLALYLIGSRFYKRLSSSSK
jgi:hypothetical protein